MFSFPIRGNDNVPVLWLRLYVVRMSLLKSGSLVTNAAGSCAQQTVPRAEAVVLQLALEATTSRHGLTIAVDASMLSNVFACIILLYSFVPLNCRNADVWGPHPSPTIAT